MRRTLPRLRCNASVGQRLGQVAAQDRLAGVHIGDGARDLQDPVVASRGQPQLFNRLRQKRLAVRVRAGHALEEFAVSLGVGPDSRLGGRVLVTL